jgi:hypothetical protein
MQVKILTIGLLIFLAGCKADQLRNKLQMVWQREIQYWDYVIKMIQRVT